MTHDFTFKSISQFYKSIPYNMPTIKLCLGTSKNQCLDYNKHNYQSVIMEEPSTNQTFFANQFNQYYYI